MTWKRLVEVVLRNNTFYQHQYLSNDKTEDIQCTVYTEMSVVAQLIRYSQVYGNQGTVQCSREHGTHCLELSGVVLHSCKYSNGVKSCCVFHIVTSVHKLGRLLYL